MLKIRLARAGRKKRPFFRIVLTEHIKPVHAGYQEVLGWFDPLNHTMEVDVDQVKAWFAKGARPSNRMAKLLHKHTNDDFFKEFIVYTTRTRTKRKETD
jgi:small subunit ribosomal protein S16